VTHSEIGWGILDRTLVPLTQHFERSRRAYLRAGSSQSCNSQAYSVAERLAGQIFHDGVVLGGPFAGMRYPEKRAIGSAIYPKLLGSYEMELHPLFDRLRNQEFGSVVDIGCAE